MNYSTDEQTDMLLVYGFCQGNGRESVRVYQQRFPNRRIPNHKTFARIERRLRETGTLRPKRLDAGRPRTVRTAEHEEAVLEMVYENPEISTRMIHHQLNVPRSTNSRIIREQLLHPYHKQPVHDLLPLDTDRRLHFCAILVNRRAEDDLFYNKILFTDESCFTRRGITNLHNEHVYSDQNPHATTTRHFQTEFKINVWMGIIDSYLIGPFRLPQRLNGENYLYFLQQNLQPLLEDLPLNLRQNMVFMHDGAPAHFSGNVQRFLTENYPDRWIGRGQHAPIHWPPRSPDLNPCDFYIWGALKSKVYERRIDTVDELWTRIQNAANSLRRDNNFASALFNFYALTKWRSC